jgi:tRNA dimethylallyltransferase
MLKKVVVLTGPTATGKTALGVWLARECGAEIISADSMQIYRHMDVGTAKPTREEMGGVAHHMLDVASPLENYSVARYSDEAAKAADDIISRGRLPMLVGGSGLFIDSLIAGREFAPEDTTGLRAELSEEYDRLGGERMLEKLAKFDPESAGRLSARDKKRVVRAYEVYRLTGETISGHDTDSKSAPPRYEALYIELGFSDRNALYARIDGRVDEMIKRGFREEARALMDMGLTKRHNSAQAIGYREMLEAALGEITPEEAVETTKRRSRQYAKRQLTWLRRRRDALRINWGAAPNYSEGVRVSTEYMRRAGYI